MSETTRLIKKYKNRRLYDTQLSQYITVEDLQRYVIEGVRFRVEDSTEGHDITNATLLQIFVEMEAGSSPFFSSDMLRQLILLAHHPMHQSLKTMMSEMMRTLQLQTESNEFMNNVKKIGDVWSLQTQQAMKQWQDLFK